MKQKKKVLISVVAVCVVAGAIFIPRAFNSSEKEAAVSVPQYYTAQRDTLSTTITASASLTMPRQAKLTFGVGGIVKKIYVDFGSTVMQGQVLAELDTTDSLERALEQAEGNLTIAQANLDKIQNPSEATIVQAQAAVAAAKANLQSAVDALDEIQNPTAVNLAQARAAVANAEAALKSAQSALEIAQDPDIGDLAQTQAAVSDAQLTLDNAERDLIVAQNNASTSITTAENTVETQETLYSTVINNYVVGKATIEEVNTQADNLVSAQAQLENAQASTAKSVSNAENMVTKAQNSLLQAQIELNNTISGVSLEVKEAAVESARVALEQARESLDDMLAGGNMADLEAAQARAESAKATLLAAQDTLSNTLAGGDPETLISKQLQVSNAQAAVDDAEEDITEATITAPFDGVIATSISVQEGDSISSGTAIMQLVDTSEIQIEAAIDEVDVFDIAAGQKVNVTFEYLSDLILTGIVKAVSPLATSSSGIVSYDALIIVDEVPEGIQFYEGLTSTIDIITAESTDTLVIPSKAITTNNGIKTVQVMVNGVPQTRAISVGIVSGTQTEVTSGLSEGEQILVGMSTASGSGSATTTGTATTTTNLGNGGLIGGGFTGGGRPPSGGFPVR